MSKRKEFLEGLGYKEPFDSSPVEVPSGWQGGSVINVGGNTMCRVWRNFDQNTKQSDIALEVIYNVNQDKRVELQEYGWDESREAYVLSDQIESKSASDKTDESQAQIALEFMEKHPL